MGRFLLGRLIQLPIVLAMVYAGTFAVCELVPGDQIGALTDKNLTAENLAFKRQQFDYDLRSFDRFLVWLNAMSPIGFETVRRFDPTTNTELKPGQLTTPVNAPNDYPAPRISFADWSFWKPIDLGRSLRDRPISEEIGRPFLHSLTIGIVGFAFAAVLGTALGVLAAARRGGVVDAVSLVVALIGISLPSFVVLAGVIYLLGYKAELIPARWSAAHTLEEKLGSVFFLQGIFAEDLKAGVRSAVNGVLGEPPPAPQRAFNLSADAAGSADLAAPPADWVFWAEFRRTQTEEQRLIGRLDASLSAEQRTAFINAHRAEMRSIGWQHSLELLVPALALALSYIAYVSRLTRASMIDALGQDFVRSSRAKGCSEARTILKHAYPNARLAVVSYLGPAAAAMLVGGFVVESLYGIPGMAKAFTEAATSKDMRLLLATTMIYSFMLVLFNLLVDLSYAWLDPRIRRT